MHGIRMRILNFCVSAILISSYIVYFTQAINVKTSTTKLQVVAKNAFISADKSSIVDYKEKSLLGKSQLLRFGIPTLGIWILQPILSLIDSSVIGISAGVTELAALGPGIAWIDCTSYLVQVVGMFVTSQIAQNFDDDKKVRRSISHSMVIALFLGILLTLIQFVGAEGRISVLSGAAVEAVKYGVTYAQIRSFAAPAATLTIVAQAAFLATKDTITPLKAVAIGAVVNTVLDVYFVLHRKSGIAGAAFATAISQYSGAIYLLSVGLMRCLKEKNVKTTITKKRIFEMIELPTKKDIIAFRNFAAPLFFVLFLKCYLWTYTTYVASKFGVNILAAHQIIINLFLYFYIFGDVISTMVQNFLPPFVKGEKCIDASGWRVLRHILELSAIISSGNCVMGLCLPFLFPHVFTKSDSVIAAMKQIALPLASATLPHCLLYALEGALIVTKDLKFLFFSYGFAAFYFIFVQSLVRSYDLGLQALWWVMASYQWLRLFMFSIRLYRNSRHW